MAINQPHYTHVAIKLKKWLFQQVCFAQKNKRAEAFSPPEVCILYLYEEHSVIWRVMENQQMRQQCVIHNTSSIKAKNSRSVTPLACFVDRRSNSYEGPAVGMCPGVSAGLHTTDRSVPNSHEAVRPRVPARHRLLMWWLQMEEEPKRDLHKGSVIIWIWNHQNLDFSGMFCVFLHKVTSHLTNKLVVNWCVLDTDSELEDTLRFRRSEDSALLDLCCRVGCRKSDLTLMCWEKRRPVDHHTHKQHTILFYSTWYMFFVHQLTDKDWQIY